MAERSAPNYKNLISRFASSAQWERTLETARLWLSVEPENINAHYAAGRTLVTLNRHAEAEPHVTRILAESPDHIDSHRLMAVIHFTAGRFKAADESIEKAISLDPTQAGSWYELARMCYSNGSEASAKKFAAKALELSPRHPYIMALLIACEPVDSSNVDQILARYREVLELNPTYAPAHEGIGSCLEYKRDYQGAEESFRRALFFEPSRKSARSNLFIFLKNRDRIFRALHAPKDFLLKSNLSVPRDAKGRKESFLYILICLLYVLVVPCFQYASLFIGLAFWFLLFWPLVKAYEYLTIGDIHSKAGEVDAKRGGFLGYRQLSLRVRLLIFATFLAAFWGGSALFLLNRYSSTIKHIWSALWGHPIRSGFIAYGCCLFFCVIAYFFGELNRRVQRSRSESHARRGEKIFGTLSEPEPVKRRIKP